MSSTGPMSGTAGLPALPASAGVNVGVLSIANEQVKIVLELLEAASSTSEVIHSESSSGPRLDKIV